MANNDFSWIRTGPLRANAARLFNTNLRTGLKVSIDKLNDMQTALNWLGSKEVMVGIPEDDTDRTDTSTATNSLIAYAHEFGEPAHNLPARPFLRPGVERTEADWTKSFENAARQAFEGNISAATNSLMRAGDKAAKGAQQVIRDQDFVELSRRTIEERLRKIVRGHKQGAQRVAKYRAMTNLLEQAAWESANIKILQDTNQMFRAITYVIRNR